MIELKKLIRVTGITLIFFALLANPFFIAWFFAGDKKIESWQTNLEIIFFQWVLFLTGACIYYLPKWNIRLKSLAYPIYFILLPCTIFFSGGLLILLPEKAGSFIALRVPLALIIMFGLPAFLLAKELFEIDGRVFIFANISFLLGALFTLYFSELLASFFVPPWPVTGLHGVKPELGRRGWGRVISINGGIGFNSWGERDRERKKIPPPGVKRVIFLGDSFLEESTAVPLSLATEGRLNPGIEIINLGVSCSAPDEYYYRMKNIALPLKPEHVFLFFYTGNDFFQKDSLYSFFGVVATYPRESFFVKIGLKSLNHIITNSRRPVLVWWGTRGEANDLEQDIGRRFAGASDEKAEEILMSFIEEKERDRLRKILAQKDMRPFYAMLRHPDQGLFRSFGLWIALDYMVGKPSYKSYISEAFSYSWVKRTYELCRKNNIRFTLVIAPYPFSVDKRMQKLWAPLTDMAELTRPIREATERLLLLAQKDGIGYINLTTLLKDYPGAFLNLDIHLSEKGVTVISDFLANYIKSTER